MNRRDCLQAIKAMGLLSLGPSQTLQGSILKRVIPSSGEKLPVVGVGTWQTFDIAGETEERNALKEVMSILLQKGGSVVDSSPMYGKSEQVVGDLSTELKINDKLFVATKVWTTGRDNGIRQMNESLRLLRRDKIELMQIHNLTDWETHLKTIRNWKEQGKFKYIGLTHYTDSAHDRLVSILGREKVDFIQINYNLLERNAEKKLLPYAQDNGVAVIINQPFESGALFRRVNDKALPDWAKEFDCHSWAQFFLKYILANPAVTCVIPGTGKPAHMIDNMQAGWGDLPDKRHLTQMIRLMD